MGDLPCGQKCHRRPLIPSYSGLWMPEASHCAPECAVLKCFRARDSAIASAECAGYTDRAERRGCTGREKSRQTECFFVCLARGALCTGLELQGLRLSDHHDFYSECRWNGRMRAHMLWWASQPVKIVKDHF